MAAWKNEVSKKNKSLFCRGISQFWATMKTRTIQRIKISHIQNGWIAPASSYKFSVIYLQQFVCEPGCVEAPPGTFMFLCSSALLFCPFWGSQKDLLRGHRAISPERWLLLGAVCSPLEFSKRGWGDEARMKLQNALTVVLQMLTGIISFGSVPKPLDPCPEIHCKQDMVGLSAMRMTSSFWIRWVAKSSPCGVHAGPEILNFFLWGNRPWPSCHALYDLARINRFNFYDFTIFYREALLGSFEWETSSCVFCFVGIGVVEFQPMFFILQKVLTTVVWSMGIYLHWMISDDFMQFTSFGWILQLGLGVDSYDWIDTCRYKL